MTLHKLLTTTLASIIFLSACQLPDKPITQQEALALGHRIEASIDSKNPAVLNTVFDERQFAKRVLAEAHARFNLSLAAEARSVVTEMKWGEKMIASIGTGGSYQLLRQYEKDGHQHLLFRLFTGNGAINYHDYELYKGDETVKARDVYVYMSGEELTKTMAESLALLSDKLDGMSKDEQEKLLRVKKINELLDGGNPEEAESIYDEVPAGLKKQRLFQLIHVRIASKLGDSTYLAALNEYKANFPKDPNLYFLMFDAEALQNDFSGALNSINHLDSVVHRDPFLDFYRGILYARLNDPLKSRLAFERLHTSLPKFSPGTAQLLVSYLTAGYPDSAATIVKEAGDRGQMTPDQQDSLEKTYPALKRYLK